MIKKINCIYNEQGAWCKNKNVKRSLFGIGARCCTEFDGGTCPLKVKHERPSPPAKPNMGVESNVKCEAGYELPEFGPCEVCGASERERCKGESSETNNLRQQCDELARIAARANGLLMLRSDPDSRDVSIALEKALANYHAQESGDEE